jgi:hypothetical protein
MNTRPYTHVVLGALCIGTIIGLLVSSAYINRWEHKHDYPFGRMCNSVFTLWEDACPTK